MPWMEEIGRQLNEKVSQVNNFNITFERVKKEVTKRKGWTAPGIDGIQNYWWKKLQSAQKALTRAFTKIKEDNTNIPTWWPTGRTALLSKTKSLEDEKDYRPTTCLNASYKIMTGVVAKYMGEHTMKNEIWDAGQLGVVEGMLGMVDQLIIDRCIMEEVKQYHRNLAVAFHDYQKAYGRWINISCGFLQGDSYSLFGFCISKMPVCRLLQQGRGYRMGPLGNRDVSRTQSLFIDDLKVYQESHKILTDVNEVIVQASHDTGACYGISKCVEIVFERGKMVRGGLEILEE